MADTYDEPPVKRANVDTQAAQIGNHRSSSGSSADSNVTLWQFLLDLLLKQQYSNIICWTNNDGEFKLLDAEQVAKLWGLKKNKHNMNYDKLSRALRYYYDKNIIKKVMGQKFVYKFVSFPEMVKTENRIPFKKKMESIVNESATSSQTPATAANASSFQTLRPYDVKSGLIQQAQLAAVTAHNQLIAQQHVSLMALEEQRRQRERLAVNTSTDGVYIKTEAVSPGSYQPRVSPPPGLSSKVKTDEDHSLDSPSVPTTQSQSGLLSAPSSQPTDLSMRRPSPSCTPLSVCTPAASPAPPVFDMPGSSTPTPPPKPSSTNPRDTECEVKVKLEIPELDVPAEDRSSYKAPVDRNQEPPAKRTLKHTKSKPDPISISNDVTAPGPVVHSPLTNRNLLPSLNTPMFLTSPLLGSRTPLLPGLHFWPPGTLSPVATLSPRLPGAFPGATAFQFPSFAVSPATLASFSTLSDSVFANSNANTPTPASATDKKLS